MKNRKSRWGIPLLPTAAATLILLAAAPRPAPAQTTETGGVDINLFAGWQFYKHGRIQDLQNGVIGGVRVDFDFMKHFGIEGGVTAGKNDVQLLPVANFPNQKAVFPARSIQVGFGPMLYLAPPEKRIRPFATVGAAAMWFTPDASSVSALDTAGNSYFYPVKGNIEPAMYYGAGVKMRFTDNVGVRFDIRGLWTKAAHFGLPGGPTGPAGLYSPKTFTDDALQVTGGVYIHFGRHKEEPPPPPPPAPAPVVRPPAPEFSITGIMGARDVCPGETLELRATTTGVPSDANYSWMLNGKPVSATGNLATISTTGLSGQQEVVLTITAGGTSKSSEPARFTVKGGGPIEVTFPQPRSPITVGEKVPLSATATEPGGCGGTPRITYSASDGTVSGDTYDSSTVSFDPRATKRQEKPVTITATATDDAGKTGTATANIVVTSTPTARRLDDLVFSRGSARVNNCAKRLLLEELTPLLRDNPDSTVVLIGHRDADEKGKAMQSLDRTRVLNAAAVLSAGTGICPSLDLSRVKVKWAGTDQSSQPRPSFCGASTTVKERSGSAVSESDTHAQYRRVEIWFVPSGAAAPTEASGAENAPAAAVKKLGCPK